MRCVLIILALLATACQNPAKKEQEKPRADEYAVPEKAPLVLAISKAYEKQSYRNWFREADSTMIFINMYKVDTDSLELMMAQCHGLLLTGGEDVHPGWHGKTDEKWKCGRIDTRRDSLEKRLLDMATERGLPVLGICRGHQVMNAMTGGSLYTDLPTDIKSGQSHRADGMTDAWHLAYIRDSSILSGLSGRESRVVNSNHHQGIDRLSPLFRVTAFSPEGLPEAIEVRDTLAYNVMMGVQWHPERMFSGDGFSGRLRDYFIRRMHLFQTK